MLDGEHVSDIDPAVLADATSPWSIAAAEAVANPGLKVIEVEGTAKSTGAKAVRGVGEMLEFETTDGSATKVKLPQPAIFVTDADKVMDGSDWTFKMLTGPGTMETPYEEVLISLAVANGTCFADRPFLSVGGKFYRLEKRLKLHDNTLEVPAALPNATACPTVKRNY